MANLDEKTGPVGGSAGVAASPNPTGSQPSISPAAPSERASSVAMAEEFPSPMKLPSPLSESPVSSVLTTAVSSPKPPSAVPLPLPKQPLHLDTNSESHLSHKITPVMSSSPVPSSSPPAPEDLTKEKIPPFPLGVSVNKSRPLILKLAIVILIAGALLGIAFGVWKYVLPLLPAQIKPGGVTLTWWGLWEDENILKPLIEDYEKTHRGVQIEYKRQSSKEYRERLQAAVGSGKGPDIFRFHNTWLPMLKGDLSPMPASVFSPDDFKDTFYSVVTEDLKSGSSYYGVPLEVDGLALVYNPDILKAANVSPPTSWEEFQKAARILTVKDEKGKIRTAGAAMGTTANIDHWSDILGTMFLQDGLDLRNPQGGFAEDALIFYTSFAQGENKTWDETLPSSTLAFAQGKVAMVFEPSWEILTIRATNPKLNFKVIPVPQLPGVNIPWASYWVEGVSIKSTHQAEAWEFLKYLSQKENLVKFYTESAKTRLFGEPYSRRDLAPSLKENPYIEAYIRQAPNARSFFLASKTFDNGINDKIIKYLEDAVNSVNQGVSPKNALTTATAGVRQVLSTYGVSLAWPAPAK